MRNDQCTTGMAPTRRGLGFAVEWFWATMSEVIMGIWFEVRRAGVADDLLGGAVGRRV
jgi:hypothetical protein